jgi:hypothetical protein
MSDALLSKTDRQSALSVSFVSAIAAGAGYTTAIPDCDRDSIDLIVGAGGSMRPQLAMQLKASTNLRTTGTSFVFPLSIKNYNDLRAPRQVPLVLVVLDMPKLEKNWLNVTSARMILRRAAYWCSLAGALPTENETSVSVQVPQAQILDVDSLKALMEKSRHGAVI